MPKSILGVQGLNPWNILLINVLLADMRKDYNQALEYVNRAIQIDPKNLNLLDTRASILAKSEQKSVGN